MRYTIQVNAVIPTRQFTEAERAKYAIRSESGTDSKDACKLDYSQDALVKLGSKETKLLVNNDLGSTSKMREDFKESACVDETDSVDWYSNAEILPVGTAHALVSVDKKSSFYTGGAHPSGLQGYVTIDSRNGKRLKLDQLLTRREMDEVVNHYCAAMKRQGGEDMDPAYDKKGARRVINDNFAIDATNGKIRITVILPAQDEASEGTGTVITFDAPTRADFLRKIGAR